MGNGADYENYSWTQTLSEVCVTVPVPSGVRAKELDVKLEKKQMTISVKTTAQIVLEVYPLPFAMNEIECVPTQGEFSAAIKPEECYWNMGKALV